MKQGSRTGSPSGRRKVAALSAALVLAACSGEPLPPEAELPAHPAGEKWCGLFAEEQLSVLDPREPESRRQEVDTIPREFDCTVWGDVDQPARSAPIILAARTRAFATREVMEESRWRHVLTDLAPDGCMERVPDDEYERWICRNDHVLTYVTCLVPSDVTPGKLEEYYYYTAVDGSFRDEEFHTAEELVELSAAMDVFALNFHGCADRLPPESQQ